MNDRLKDLGTRIRQARKQKKLSQAELADIIQISPSHMSDIENGKKTLKIDLFMKITEALQVSADWLLRTNIPEVNSIYEHEISDLLKDCTTEEKEAYLDILKKLKGTFH